MIHVHHYAAEVETILMQSVPADCWACGSPEATGSNMGIPVYEDFVLPNDWPGEWGGVPACPKCFEKQNRLTEPAPVARFVTTEV